MLVRNFGKRTLRWLSEPYRRGKQAKRLVVLNAYIDDSVDGNEALVLAGYIATTAKWIDFSNDWEELLNSRPMWRALKMSAIAASGSRDQLERAGWHYRIIERYAMASVACIVPHHPLRVAADRYGLPKNWGNPYHFGFKAIVDMTAQFTEELGFSEPIHFIFDDRSEKKAIRGGWEIYRATSTSEIARYIGREPTFKDDLTTLPLQAADLYAWWVRKCWADHSTIHPEKMQMPWKQKKKIRRLILEFNEEDIFHEMEKSAKWLMALRLTKPAKITYSYDGLRS